MLPEGARWPFGGSCGLGLRPGTPSPLSLVAEGAGRLPRYPWRDRRGVRRERDPRGEI